MEGFEDAGGVDKLEEIINEQMTTAMTSADMERRQSAATLAVALEIRALRWALVGLPAVNQEAVVERLLDATHEVGTATVDAITDAQDNIVQSMDDNAGIARGEDRRRSFK